MPIDSKECFTDLTLDGQLYEIYQAAQTGGGGGSGTVTSVTGGTGLNGGTITTTGTLSVKYGTTAGTAAEGNDARLSDARIPTGSAGGDLTGTYPNPTVDGLQGRPVSNATPYNGQVLQYDGTTWVPGTIPSGGSGGGGVIYYLNFNTAADAPLINIPQTPNTSKELGLVGDVTGTSYLSPILSTASYDFLASFVTDLNVPSATAIPAGIWDFNIFIESTTTNSANQIYFKVEILKYDGVNAPTLLATSGDTYIYDPAEINQYVASVVMPQTTVLATDRIVVYLYGRAHQNNNRLTFYFGGAYPSHTHSTMPSVTGTGVAKVVNGVFQSPASTIVNADVSATAAIEVSKLSQATNRILGRTTAGTGSVEELSVAGNLTLASGTLTSKSPQIDIYTGSTTWTKPVGAKQVIIECVAGGGGGGYGGKGLPGTALYGGAGGGAGGYSRVSIDASELTEASYTVTVGSGGNGGIGATLTNATLGTFTRFIGAVQGQLAGTNAGGTLAGNGGTAQPSTGSAGAPAGNNGGIANITGTAGAGSGQNFAPTSGGAGGGLTAAAIVGSLSGVFSGGSGGNNALVQLSSGGGAASATTNGVSATPSTARTLSSLVINGSGGGGGGACSFATGSGGNGANGSGYGSGGGGGGSTIGSGDRSNGGNGAPGVMVVTTYF